MFSLLFYKWVCPYMWQFSLNLLKIFLLLFATYFNLRMFELEFPLWCTRGCTVSHVLFALPAVFNTQKAIRNLTFHIQRTNYHFFAEDSDKMASSKKKSVAEEAVQCMICMEYDGFLKCDIKLLPCSHILCTECLLQLSAVSNDDHSCKQCR